MVQQVRNVMEANKGIVLHELQVEQMQWNFNLNYLQ